MEVLDSKFTRKTNIENANLQQVLLLNRNQRDIAQFFGKLCSYRSEPKTYEQFAQLNSLKEKAWELRESNKAIASMLRTEPNVTAHGSRLVKSHLHKFDVFSKEVLTYLRKVGLHQVSQY